MNDRGSDGFDAFARNWLKRLQDGALVRFEHGPLPDGARAPSKVADVFVGQFGLTQIGFNWELLDAFAGPQEPRSALGEITQAIANRISNPNQAWLGEEKARRCASEFLNAFDPAMRTVVSNRFDGLWNPISGASVEWGFVGFDDRNAALLLIAEA